MKKILNLMMLFSLISCSGGGKDKSKNDVFTNQIKVDDVLTEKEVQRQALLTKFSLLGVESVNDKLIFTVIRDDKDVLAIDELVLKNKDLLTKSEFESYEKDYLPYYELIISEIRDDNYGQCQNFEDSFTVVDTKTEDIKKLFMQKEEVSENIRCLLYSKVYNQYNLFPLGKKRNQEQLDVLEKRISSILEKQRLAIHKVVKEYLKEDDEVIWNIDENNYQDTITFENYLDILKKFTYEWGMLFVGNTVRISNSNITGFSFDCGVMEFKVNLGPVVNRTEYLSKLDSKARSCLVNTKYGYYKYE